VTDFNAIGEFGLNEVLTKRLTTPGGSNSPSVAPELFPVLALENDRPEWGYPKGELRCGRLVNSGAVAGEFSAVQLYLPSTARSIAVVHQITSFTANVMNIGRGVGIGGGQVGWTAAATCTVDFRWAANRTQLIIETNDTAVAPSLNFAIAQLQQVDQRYDWPIIITPGTSLILVGSTVNQALSANVCWMERGAQPGELA